MTQKVTAALYLSLDVCTQHGGTFGGVGRTGRGGLVGDGNQTGCWKGGEGSQRQSLYRSPL